MKNIVISFFIIIIGHTICFGQTDAEVKIISTLDETKEKITYCWLIDKQDTINNYLIRTGCFPGGTMMRPETYEEMSAKMKELYSDIDKPKIIVHVDKKIYDNFIEQIKQAELLARKEKLGVWKNEEE